ncbi:hypothetical protein FSARC_5207 [Fusarium sarcochroum]|uniref:Zn(2)-C6 fungal-type domain-containing protein n=1 Tax=Fusarium sarcochroum TaxID=1208366 RepID=A0A8H4TZY9_9HYPO|nr:hypothetical protein FSARC_5207 [Fusarium sarcochroum]
MAPTTIDNEKHMDNQDRDDQNLERLGYVQEVKRNFSLTAMVATCVNLMSTWEALSSTLAAGLVSGGPVSLVYGMIVAFIGSLCAAMSLAELASRTLGWVALAGSAPFLAGTQIQGLLVLNYPDSYTFERWHGTMLFWAILIGSACICIFCSNSLPLIEKLTLVLHIGFFIIILVVIATVSPTKHSAEFVFAHFENNSGWRNDAVAWSIGLLSSCYVLIGYDGATHLSEEMEKAETGVPRAMVGSILINGPLGFGFLITVLFFMGDIASALNTPTGFPIIQIFYNVTGSVAAATALTGAITVMAALSTVPLITSAARIMWAFARDGGLPFSAHLAKVDKRRHIPTVSILIVTFLLVLLGLINIGSTTAFNAILSLAVVSLQSSYLLPIVLVIWRRVFRPDTLSWGPWHLGKAGIFINVIAVIYLSFTCIFLLFPPFQPITAANMNYAPVVLGGALLFGCVYWPLRKLKCDEAEPACHRCVKSGLTCPGYTRTVKWSTKYERNYGFLPGPSAIPGRTSTYELPQTNHLGFFHEKQHVSELARDSGDAIWSEASTHVQNPSSSIQRGRYYSIDQYENATGSPDITSQDSSVDELINLWSFPLPQDTAPVASTSPSFESVWNTAGHTTLSDSLNLYSPQEESSMLLSHYYSSVCQVASSFDSTHNPYRFELSGMIRSSPIIFNCVMSMSAAHLCQQDKYASLTPLRFQTEAISQISNEVAQLGFGQYGSNLQQNDHIGASKAPLRPTVKEDLLLGIIVLGMTSSWHDPSSLGLCHFNGARQLFKLWMAENDVLEKTYSLSRTQSFLVSSMVYWEVMVSCLVDQETDAISYLDAFCNLSPSFFSFPCPWTGVGTSILVRLAKCITLVRQRRRLHYLECIAEENIRISNSCSQLVKEALSLAADVGQSQVPFTIQETGDIRTPADHFYKIARCHRLVALLELHRAFPEITDDGSAKKQSMHDQMRRHSQRVLGLAVEILEIMQTISEDSGTIAIQTLIFLAAGSALGFLPITWTDGEVFLATTSKALITSWRQFVLGRLYKAYLSIKLETINRVASVLRQVWVRMDSLATAGSDAVADGKSPLTQVHWIDVMIERKLETILG